VQKIFLQTGSGTQPVSYSMDRPSGVFAGEGGGQRDGGLTLTTHRHPEPRLNMNGAINLLLNKSLGCEKGQFPIIVCVGSCV
jgi:hypothetical protein